MHMKKTLLALVLLIVLSASLFADVELTGYVSAQYKFNFKEGEPMSHYYGLEGSVAGFSIEFKELSLNKKGEKKPYAEIGVSVALSFDISGGAISWASYGFNIPAAALKGAILFHKFNIVGDLLGDEYVIDLIHNEIGADWAKSIHGNYYYTTYYGDTSEGVLPYLDFSFPSTTAITYSNDISVTARKYPGVTVKWRNWTAGVSLNGEGQEWGRSTDVTFGVISPDFKFADSQANIQFALGSIFNFSDSEYAVLGGSVKTGWNTDKLKVNIASDFGYTFAFFEEELSISDFEADASFSAEAGIVGFDFYFTTVTPLLGFEIPVISFFPTDTEITALISMDYYSDAKLSFDLHKLPTDSLPIIVSATAWDMFISRDDDLRTIPYEDVITGDHGLFSPYEDFAKERYGRDLDADLETDAFEEHHITKIHLFAHKLLQTIELGLGIEFKYGDFTFGTEGSYDLTKNELYDKLYAEYKTPDLRAYAVGIMYMTADETYQDTFRLGSVAGLSSDTFIDIATVGAEFRWDLYGYESSRLSTPRDFTVYCKVEF